MNKRNINIGIIGKMGSGKSEVARILTKELAYKEFSFAEDLKYFTDYLFDIKPSDKKPRDIYQRVGQMIREIDSNVWVNSLKRNINRYYKTKEMLNEEPRPIVVSDVRQPNEYQALKDMEYLMIKIETDNDEKRLLRMINRNDNFKKEHLKHETEMYIDDMDYDILIKNNSSLNDLEKNVKRLFSMINYGIMLNEVNGVGVMDVLIKSIGELEERNIYLNPKYLK